MRFRNDLFLILLLVTACAREASPRGALHQATGLETIDYQRMDPLQALDKKYELMQPHLRNDVEREILRVLHAGLREGKAQGLWAHIDMEDLMAHARQEAAMVIDLLDQGKDITPANARGTNAWDFHMIPANDLNGNVSFSVWQAVEVNYLEYGRKYDATLKALYEDFLVKYGHEGRTDLDEGTRQMKNWAFKKNMIAALGAEKAAERFNEMIKTIARTCAASPDLHVKVIADLVSHEFATHGVNTPNGLRAYFWIDIQRNLNPDNWYKPVLVPNDRPPSPGQPDVFAGERGDYGKQIVLGNSYNDRGMIFWYAVTGDGAAVRRLVDAWESDPARLRRKDYQLMRDKGYLRYVTKNPEIYEAVVAHLPE